jgi:hypothetical protein
MWRRFKSMLSLLRSVVSHIVIEGRLRAGILRLGLSIAGSAGGVDFDEVIDTRHSIFASACALDEPCVSVDTDGGILLEPLPTSERHHEPKPPTCVDMSLCDLLVHPSS